MLSDQLQKFERISSRNLFLVAAVLVIVCQLVAMAMVADGQVKKAQLREAQISAQNIALASCFESSSRLDRNSCVPQPQAENSLDVGSTTGNNGAAQSAGFFSGLTNVTFVAR